METKLQQHLNKLHQFDAERKGWLILSGFVAAVILGIVFSWNYAIETHVIWLIVSSGLTITAVWWYWTMRVIRHLIQSKTDEYNILNDLLVNINEIKQDVKNSLDLVDKDK